jgi:hypothetical protein
MSQLINSGIIYLEQFVDSTNLLPADLSRSLAYIRTLDERISSALVHLHLALISGARSCVGGGDLHGLWSFALAKAVQGL